MVKQFNYNISSCQDFADHVLGKITLNNMHSTIYYLMLNFPSITDNFATGTYTL